MSKSFLFTCLLCLCLNLGEVSAGVMLTEYHIDQTNTIIYQNATYIYTSEGKTYFIVDLSSNECTILNHDNFRYLQQKCADFSDMNAEMAQAAENNNKQLFSTAASENSTNNDQKSKYRVSVKKTGSQPYQGFDAEVYQLSVNGHMVEEYWVSEDILHKIDNEIDLAQLTTIYPHNVLSPKTDKLPRSVTALIRKKRQELKENGVIVKEKCYTGNLVRMLDQKSAKSTKPTIMSTSIVLRDINLHDYYPQKHYKKATTWSDFWGL